MAQRSDHTYHHSRQLLPQLLAGPNEIKAAVLRWLDVEDILNLRISCRRLHMLIHDLAQNLYADHFGRLKKMHGALGLPEKHVPEADLTSYIELLHRHSYIWELAGVLSNHLTSKVKIQGSDNKVADVNLRLKKASLLQKALFAHLFILDRFLDRFRNILAKADEAFADWDSETYLSAHEILLLDQQHLIVPLCGSPATILGVGAAHSILMGVCRAKTLGPRVRSPTYPFASIKRLMIGRGLAPFAEILNERDHAARLVILGRACEQLIRPCQVKQHTYTIQSVQHLDIARYSIPGAQTHRPCKVIEKFLERQDIWQKAAFAVLQRGFSLEPSQLYDNTDDWIMETVAEAGDPSLSLGDWIAP